MSLFTQVLAYILPSAHQQNYLPDELEGHKLYEPGQNPRENDIRKTLNTWWGDWYGYV